MPDVVKRSNRRGTATRKALTEAAIDLWAEAGWQVTGIGPVAERVGVTSAGLLRHFGTKENFVLHVLAELDRREVARFEGWGPSTGLDMLRRLPDMARAGMESPGLWKLHLMFQAQNMEPGTKAYDYYVERQQFLHQVFAGAVRDGQMLGEIRADADADLVAAQALAFLIGMRLHIEHGPSGVDAITVFEDFVDRYIRDLTPR